MLINKQNVKRYINDAGKRVSPEALPVIERKLKVLLDAAVKATNGYKTITARDVSMYSLRMVI